MRSLITTTTLVLALAACTDQPGMMDAEFHDGEDTPAAPDRAPPAATMKEDERHALVLAILDKLIDEHPAAAGGRINLGGIFGDAYRGETVTHAGRDFQRISNGTRVAKDTYTISFRGLKLTADNEATIGVGLIHADEDGSVADHFYDVRLVRVGDAWSADLTYKGHFDGELGDRAT